jgi:GxxExxY protein
MLSENELTDRIIGAAIEVHRHLGPGLLESAYEECLCFELSRLGLAFRRQVDLPIEYKGIKLDCGYRLDLIVEETVIVELKATDDLIPIHSAQLLTYLKSSGKRVGLLINFNVPVLKNGLKRMVNGYEGPVPKTSISAPSVLDSLPADPQSRAETRSNRPVLSPPLPPRLRDSAVNGEPQ